MSAPGLPTLDQLRVLTTVAETGSFSAAARRLNRAQSVVSYSIANLEAQLGLALFERGQRRPVLTEAGRTVLSDARKVGVMVEELRARVAGLNKGLEAELSLVVDVMFPTCALVAALDDFARAFPTVSLHLHVEALGAVVQRVLDGTCGLGIAGWMAVLHPCLEQTPLGETELVPVAAPSHPLAALRGTIPRDAVRDHTQLVLADRSTLTQGQDFGVLSTRTWRLGDLGAKHALLRGGLGWGNMPAHMIADDLASGQLRRLAIAGHDALRFALMLIHRSDASQGPAAQWLAARLIQTRLDRDRVATGTNPAEHPAAA